MKRKTANELNLPIAGIFRSFAAVGVDPAHMGIGKFFKKNFSSSLGPAFAIPEAVKKAGLTLDDIDLFEINEAFASQFVYCLEKLGLDYDKVNVNGGAIGLFYKLFD